MSSEDKVAAADDIAAANDGNEKQPASTEESPASHVSSNNDEDSLDTKPPPSKSAKKKSPKSTSSKKTPASSSKKKSPSPNSSKKKPTMTEMIHAAILALGDRTGSSGIAIGRYILGTYGIEDSKSFRSRLNSSLKTGVKNERFKKIRNSYKIDAAYARKEREKHKKQSKKLNQVEQKKLDEQQKLAEQERQRQLEATMTTEELQALRAKQAKEREAQRKRQEAEQLAKERAERIRKRRFPMEDTKLHKEDKELGVKPPADVTRRPSLPYFFHATLALDDSKREGRTPSGILAASKCDFLEYGSRGLVPDLLQVYHFFRGDVHFFFQEDTPLVPDFELNHLLYAVDEILNGNAKKSRLVPPLISHLFVTCLKLLTMTSESAVGNETVPERRLRQDLQKLSSALNPASWGDVCALYMDAMERYYTSSATLDPNVLPSGKIDVAYLMRATDVAEPMTPAVTKNRTDDEMEVDALDLPEGYCGYLGNPHGTLAIAQAKLLKQDPWNLKADELMALLRALTDDVLASSPEIAEDLARRDEEMNELLKAKRAADSHFRKIRLAYEGPKNPSKSKSSDKKKEADADETKESEQPNSGSKENAENSTKDEDEKDEAASKFKPTATKKQFDAAVKAQQKAHDAYIKGLRTLTARTEPVGYDRNHNSVYFFNHDPERLYIEISKPPTGTDDSSLPPDMLMNKYAWHVIETKSLFDAYVSSLDTRGKRENNLCDELLGPSGGHYSLKRHLYDDLKEENDKAARMRQREELDRRLVNAKIACQAEEEGGRRSGRLQSKAQIDLAEVEEEIENLEKKIAADDEAPEIPNYEVLTGLEMLSKFDKAGGRRETRRSRERKEASSTKEFPQMPCTKLIPSGNVDDTGLVGLIVSKILELEETCESLAPWKHEGVSRDGWIADLEERVHAWSSSAQLVVGPQNADDASESLSDSFGTPASASRRSFRTPGSFDSSDSKRRKLDSGSPASASSLSQASPSQILTLLKSPLLDLENRVFEITGLAAATRDADEADDNMSASSEDKRSRQEQKEKLAWKKKIHSIRPMDARMHVQIREAIVEAITAARKAHFGSIVTKLRSALLLHQSQAAGACRDAAIAVLDSHGGYHEEDYDDSDDESEMEEDAAEEKEDAPSALSVDAMALTGSLGGDDDADRVDWIDAVKGCKTLSRWAALASSFLSNADALLAKTEAESKTLWDSLKVWEREEDRKARSRAGKPTTSSKKKEDGEATEVWANVRFTDEFCMAKIDGSPYWPAKKCKAKDEELAKSLHAVGRTLVSLIGEKGGLRAVRLEDIKSFDGSVVEDDLEEYPKSIRTQLDECMVMARRIARGRSHKSNGGYREEKKMAM